MFVQIIKSLNNNSIDFTAIGVICTTIIGIITLFVSIHNNKSNYYVNTITQSRIEWINTLRTLISEYICLSYINYHCATDNLFSENTHKLLIKLSSKIQLMLNATGKYDKQIIDVVETIKNDYSYLIDLYELINENGESLLNHTLNEEIMLNPSFISYLTRIANEKGLPTKETSFYLNDMDKTFELFVLINKTPDDTQKFIDNLYEEPAKIIDKINFDNKELKELTQAYLKSEWNRVKKESNGRKYNSSRQNKEIEKVLSDMKKQK